MGHVASKGQINAYKILDGKTEQKTLHTRPRHRWEDNIKILKWISDVY